MKKLIRLFTPAFFAFVCLCALSSPSATRAQTTAPAATASAAGTNAAGSFAITNARVVTVSGATLERGTVVVRDGLIEAVGENVRVPADARVFDGSGLTVYPGFFDAQTSLGIPSAPARAPGQPPTPAALTTQPPQQTVPLQSNSNFPNGLQPETLTLEQLRAGDAQFETQRFNGVTTALTVSRDGIFNGQSALINLSGETVSAMIVKAPVAQHVTFRTLTGGTYPTALMGTFSAVRQMLLDAQRLQQWQRDYAVNPRGMRRPDEDRSLEALFPVISGAMPVVFNANTEREIVRALDLAKEFKLKAMIAGGQEAWKVAGRLKEQNVPVLVSLNFPKRTTTASPEADPEDLETLRLRAEAPKNAARLAQAGVKFAFQSGNLTNYADFWPNAAKAVEGGLSKDAAVRAMTLGAAEIFGVETRLGSIETGKIANLVVARGDVFSKDKTITHVFVDGRLFEPKPPAAERRPGGGSGAGTPPASGAAVNVTGTWNVTIDVPGQAVPATFNFQQEGGRLTGNIQSSFFGSAQIRNGVVSGDSFTFDVTVAVGGQNLDVTISGKVSGTQINGTANSPQGPANFSGAKIP